VQIQGGSLHIGADVCSRYFAGVESVVLQHDNQQLLILPVRDGAGGFLLKVRNAHGDRVVHAPVFLQEHGLHEDKVKVLSVEWDHDRAALVAQWPHELR
jgi:hypothetical protein